MSLASDASGASSLLDPAIPWAILVAWLAGAAALLLDATRVHRVPFAVSVVAAPIAVWLASGSCAVAIPLALVPIGYGFHRIRQQVAAASTIAVIAAVAIICVTLAAGRASAAAFGAAAKVEGVEPAAMAAIVAAKFPGARVWSPFPGALSAACDCAFATPADADGPGARFEYAEHLAPGARPTHVAAPAGWLPPDLTGDILRRIPAGRAPFDLAPLEFDRVGVSERPVTPHDGWALADRVDVADLASERAHHWRRDAASPPGSFVARDVGAAGLVLDGGRAIHASEHFMLALDPAKPARLLLRTGGARSDTVTRGARVAIYNDATGAVIETVTVPPPGPLVEVSVALPAGVSAIRTAADAPYHAYHWFALQPE